MGLDDGLGDAEQRRAADLVDVHHVLESLEVALEHERRQLVLGAGEEHALELAHQELYHALAALEHDVARESVRHDDVHVPAQCGGALDVADEVYAALVGDALERRPGLLLQLRALGLLRAVIEQADPRVRAAEDVLGVEAAHEGELQQVLAGALRVRAAVYEHDAPAAVGDDRPERRAADAADALYGERGAREQRSGAAGGDHGVAPALLEQVQRHGHGGVLLPPRRRARVVLHRDDLAGVDYLYAALAAEVTLDVLAPADQRNVHAQLALCTDRTRYGRLRRIVAAHGVNYYPQSSGPPYL